jgi:DNA-binding LacI/PurR family transcriptional regulator
VQRSEGNRRVTIVDVAQAAGVAISSASAALNNRPGVSDATRERVRAVADELGFVASLRAKSLSSRRAFAIGLVVERPADVLEADPFFGAFIAGVERAAAARDFAVVLQIAEDAEEGARRYRELAASRRVDGVILDELTDPDPRVGLVQDLGLPAVGVDAGPGFPFPAVRQGSAAGVSEAVAHLIGFGHKDIAHVAGLSAYVHARERAAAWRSTLEAAGLEPGPVLAGDFTFDAGQRAADGWLALKTRPTAVVCVNDLCAIGFMLRLQEAGVQVPGEVSVTGFDGIALGTWITPALTTVQATPRQVGHAAATLLLDLVENPGQRPADVRVEPGRLVVRGSTGPA